MTTSEQCSLVLALVSMGHPCIATTKATETTELTIRRTTHHEFRSFQREWDVGEWGVGANAPGCARTLLYCVVVYNPPKQAACEIMVMLFFT